MVKVCWLFLNWASRKLFGQLKSCRFKRLASTFCCIKQNTLTRLTQQLKYVHYCCREKQLVLMDSPDLFFFIFLYLIELPVNKKADDWIQSADLYQLCHSHCPIMLLGMLISHEDFIPKIKFAQPMNFLSAKSLYLFELCML